MAKVASESFSLSNSSQNHHFPLFWCILCTATRDISSLSESINNTIVFPDCLSISYDYDSMLWKYSNILDFLNCLLKQNQYCQIRSCLYEKNHSTQVRRRLIWVRSRRNGVFNKSFICEWIHPTQVRSHINSFCWTVPPRQDFSFSLDSVFS